MNSLLATNKRSRAAARHVNVICNIKRVQSAAELLGKAYIIINR